MRRITMTQFRAGPGEIVRAVQKHGENFEVTKAGRPAVRIVPAEDSITIWSDGRVTGDASLLPGIAALRTGATY